MKKTFPLIETATDWLRIDDDGRYQLHPLGTDAIARAIDALFASGLPARAPLLQLVQLAANLARTHRATKAATKIIDVILASKPARTLLELDKLTGEAERRHRLLGRPAPAMRAPHVGTPPTGGLTIADLRPIPTVFR